MLLHHMIFWHFSTLWLFTIILSEPSWILCYYGYRINVIHGAVRLLLGRPFNTERWVPLCDGSGERKLLFDSSENASKYMD